MTVTTARISLIVTEHELDLLSGHREVRQNFIDLVGRSAVVNIVQDHAHRYARSCENRRSALALGVDFDTWAG